MSCDVKNGTVLVNCENAAKLGERKNVNLPGVCVDLPTITEKDRDDLLNWGVKNKVDFVAASFVRKGKDVEYIRRVLGEAGKTTHVIAKVENMEGLDNYDDIVAQSDGVMVARGDLGMEIHLEQIFLAQKRMIKRCNEAGKPVVTATQMLRHDRRAAPDAPEATDVANAVLDGTDAVMLSGEPGGRLPGGGDADHGGHMPRAGHASTTTRCSNGSCRSKPSPCPRWSRSRPPPCVRRTKSARSSSSV